VRDTVKQSTCAVFGPSHAAGCSLPPPALLRRARGLGYLIIRAGGFQVANGTVILKSAPHGDVRVLLGKLGSCRLLVHLSSPPAACATQPVCCLTRACSSATSACVLVLVDVCAATQPTSNLMTCVQQWSLQMQRCKVLLGRERSDTCSKQPCLPAHLQISPECMQRSTQSGLAAAVHM